MSPIGIHSQSGYSRPKSAKVDAWRPAVNTTYSWYDDFYSFSGGNIDNHQLLLHPSNVSNGWHISRGGWITANGRLEASFPVSNNGALNLDHNNDTVVVRVEFEFPSTGTSRAFAAALRVQDADNMWLAGALLDSAQARIQEDIANTLTTRSSFTYTFLADTRYAIKFEVSGSDFTATYYTVVNGVDTVITPTSGSNPLTYTAASGDGAGRSKHGMRVASATGAASFRIYKWESSLKNTPVVNATTVNTGAGVVSRMVPAMSFAEGSPVWNASGWATTQNTLDAACGAFKMHIYPFGNLDPWPSDASGPTTSSPTWGSATLPSALTHIREVNATAPIILTIYGGCWWMKGKLNASAGTTTLMTSSEKYSDEGRVMLNYLDDFKVLVDEAVEIAAAQGCKDFEIWNEFKGYYSTPTNQAQAWDSSFSAGTANHADMGFSYFADQVSRQVVTTMTRLGYARNTYRIGAPYPTSPFKSTSTADSVASTHPLYAYRNLYGYANKEGINAAIAYLATVQAQGTPFDYFTFDMATGLSDGGVVSSDPFDYVQRFNDVPAYWRTVFPTYGLSSDLIIDLSELYPFPYPTSLQTTGQQALRCALWAQTYKHLIMQRVRYPITWGATGDYQGANQAEGAIITSSAAGTPTLTGSMMAYVKSNFPSGSTVYPLVSNTGKLDGFATATKMVVYNKTGASVTELVDGTSLTFSAYETKMFTR